MADFTEPTNPTFLGVRQFETNDPVLGGAAEIAGVVNSPANYALRALVARTQWLKQQIEGVDVPAATRSVAGVAQLATTAEVAAGLNDSKIVTPFLLEQKLDDAVPNASESTRGLIERANTSEAAALTDDQRAMTPEKTLTGLRGSAAQADGSNRGTARVASQSAAEVGTNNTDMMTSQRTKQSIDENAVTSPSNDIQEIQELTQTEYDDLTTKGANTLYAIVG